MRRLVCGGLVVGPFLSGSNSQGLRSREGGVRVRVWWGDEVWGCVCCDCCLSHGVEEVLASLGAKVVCSRQDFQRSGQDHVGMVAGSSKGFVGACSVCVVDGAEGTV